MRLAKRLEARIPISKNRASAHQHRKENLTQHKGPDVIAGALLVRRGPGGSRALQAPAAPHDRPVLAPRAAASLVETSDGRLLVD